MRRWWPRSLAGQAIALQIVVIAVVVVAGSAPVSYTHLTLPTILLV